MRREKYKERKQLKKGEKPAAASVDSKRAPMLRSGIDTVIKCVEMKKAKLVVIAHDVDPIEVI